MIAERDGTPIAAFAGSCATATDTLYGRYWGALEHVPCLHFEAAYYQPLEFCIEQGIGAFEGGAQGEHKMARGFLPTVPGRRTGSRIRLSRCGRPFSITKRTTFTRMSTNCANAIRSRTSWPCRGFSIRSNADDGSVYTGIPSDVPVRFEKHCNGTGAPHASRKPVRLLVSFELAMG